MDPEDRSGGHEDSERAPRRAGGHRDFPAAGGIGGLPDGAITLAGTASDRRRKRLAEPSAEELVAAKDVDGNQGPAQ